MSKDWTKEAWLVVASEGWLSAPEIMERMPSGVEVNKPHCYLFHMVRRGLLVARGSYKTRQYGVTAKCIAPYGVDVGRLCGALGFKARASE